MKKNIAATFLICILSIKNSHASEEIFFSHKLIIDTQNKTVNFLDVPSSINLFKTCKERNKISKKDTETIKSLLETYANSGHTENIETILDGDDLFFNTLKNKDTRSQFVQYVFNGESLFSLLSKERLLQCFRILKSNELLPDLLTKGICHTPYDMIRCMNRSGYFHDLEFVNDFFSIIKKRHDFVNDKRFCVALKDHFEVPFFKKFGIQEQQHNWDKILFYMDLYYSRSSYEKAMQTDYDKKYFKSYKDFINDRISPSVTQKMLDEELNDFIEYTADTLSKKSENLEAICCERVEEHFEPVHFHALILMDNQNNQVVDFPTVTTSNLSLAITLIDKLIKHFE